MATDLTKWAGALSKLQASVTKDLAEIRKQKAEIQQMKDDIYNRLSENLFIRNDKRIILSAPEVIIGNVDINGMLYGDSGTVIIRGGSVNLEGSGESGNVNTRAAIITQKGVDPGADGVQEAVLSSSMIINQAKNIVIQSNESEGYFSQSPTITGATGIQIHADENLVIEATKSVELRGKSIENELKALNKNKTSLTIDATKRIANVTKLTTEAELFLSATDLLNSNELLARTNVVDLDEAQDKFEAMVPAIYSAFNGCVDALSQLAETNRRITALEAEQKKIKAVKSNFTKKAINTHLSLSAESMNIASVDGDGNIRDTEDAVINVQTGKINVSTRKADGSLIDNSGVSIATKDVAFDLTNPKLDDKGNGDLPVVGSFLLKAKNVVFDAVDKTTKDGKQEDKEQTKDSSFYVRAENMGFSSSDVKEKKNTGVFMVGAEKTMIGSSDKEGNVSGSLLVRAKDMKMSSVDKDQNATGTLNVKVEKVGVAAVDKSGKALGQIVLNAKDVFAKSMDTDDKGADKNLAAGGNMVLVAEKMFVGRTAKKNTAKQVQISAEKTGLYGTSTTEVQQGEGKAVVQLDGGNLSVGGSKTQIYGNTTVNAKAEFKADVKAPKLTADNLEAKTSFKTTNISDGIAVPGAPSSAKLSAKLKEDDAPAPK
ncbi:MAG: hypothetical protein K5856_08510 [Bacteroidaceae bacterium]|nr:hypothetical protein [Bacteroidaceae bacterium]